MTGSERQEFFWTNMPHPFIGDCFRGLFRAYEGAAIHCSQFELSERQNLQPFYRRALFERNIREAAAAYDGSVSAKSVRFMGKGFWYHTKVIAGRVGLTQCAIGEPEAVARPANYRRHYAGAQNQIWLIPDANPDADSNDKMLYALMTYGRSAETPARPGFAEIRFPSSTLETDLPGTIDLFLEFPEIVDEMNVGMFWEFGENEAAELAIEPEILDGGQEDVG
jgi:hypothetical protein